MELVLNDLVKQYKDKTAVDGVSLTLTPGVWGLLGANGAGKTTLMRMISAILTPTSGNVLYDGIDVRTLGAAYRGVLGYLPQSFGFYPEFSVTDYLDYVAALKGLDARDTKNKIATLLDMMGLSEVGKKKIRKLSGGMQRRVGIAQALLNDPQILILDEPTSGLDPGERVYFRNILSEFAQKRIVLISTHIVSDVEYIAARNAIMKNGRLIAVDTTEELLKLADGMVWQIALPASQVDRFAQETCVVNMRNLADDRVEVRYVCEENKAGDAKRVPPKLEDLYLWIFRDETTGRGRYS